MPVYKFAFAPDAAGLDVTVKNFRTGETVDTGSLSDTPDVDGVVTYKPSLAEGLYSAEVEVPGQAGLDGEKHPSRTRIELGTLDVPASIAAGGGGVGATETAYFVATGPTYPSDGSGTPGSLTFVADDRHDALPAWASIVDGDIELGDDAGTVAFSLGGVFDFDFSATTPQGSGGDIKPTFAYMLDGGSEVNAPDNPKAGDGGDAQTTNPSRVGGVGTFTTFACNAYPLADDVADGTATPRVALTITRVAQAAVIPD